MSAFQGPRANVGQGTVKKRAQIPCSAIPIQYAREFEVGKRTMREKNNAGKEQCGKRTMREKNNAGKE
ncbi:hypothetical protein, partial [Escherichia coli]|uniref:hypothetical protein n=1 Tax=Escherichia coli TaxID=562 RepID=UPI001BDCB718